jgi:hypothetical protein
VSEDPLPTAERNVAPELENPVMYPLALTLSGPAEAVPVPPAPAMSAVKVARPKVVVETSHPFEVQLPTATVGRDSSVHFSFVYVYAGFSP